MAQRFDTLSARCRLLLVVNMNVRLPLNLIRKKGDSPPLLQKFVVQVETERLARRQEAYVNWRFSISIVRSVSDWAYAAAGADVLFAPGPQTPAEIEALVTAVAPKPLKVLVIQDIGLSVAEIAALGVRRISVSGALALAARTGFMRAAQMLRSKGSFAGLAGLVPYAELNGLFAGSIDQSPIQR